MPLFNKIVTIKIVFLCLIISNIKAQNAPFAIPYQAFARNASGVVIPSQNIQIKVGVYAISSSGTLEWEETHATATDLLGLFKIALGQGTSTGSGILASFSLIDWQAALHFIKIQIDYTGGSSYINMGASELLSVPYAFFSNGSQTALGLSINDLLDVDTTGIHNGYMLKWTGTLWKPMKDNDRDTVSFSYNAENANNSDTSSYALHHSGFADTVSYAYHTDSSISSSLSENSTNAVHSTYADTANYASNFLPYNWSIIGNVSSPANNQLGTIDNNDFVFKTNNTERFRILSNGKLGIGITNPQAQLDIRGIDGLLHAGTFSLGDTTLSYNSGTYMMWYSVKGAFRAGTVIGNQWNNPQIGNYSFAAGYNTKASGIYSVAMGNSTSALCENCISIGNNCSTSILAGPIVNGGSIAMGDSCIVTYTRALAIGSHCFSSSGFSFGYRNVTGYGTAFCFGANNISTKSTIVMGYNASSNGKVGSFVYADASSPIVTKALADNQFVVRASWGTIFYSDSTATNGVTLFAGSGSWASVSDMNKKENFCEVSGEDVLLKLSKIKITSWNYKSQSTSIRHIGPMAQDFYKAFKLGESKKKINMVDIDGVNLLAIKALYNRVNILDTAINNLNQLKVETKGIGDDQDSLDKRLDLIQQSISHK